MITRYAFTRKYRQTKHATTRSRARYGFEASPAILARIVDAIRTGKAELISPARHVYRVDCSPFVDHPHASRVIVAWDQYRHNVRTFLPHDWTEAKADAWDAAKLEAAQADGWAPAPPREPKPRHEPKPKLNKKQVAAMALALLEEWVSEYPYRETYDGMSKSELQAERERVKAHRLEDLQPLLTRLDHDNAKVKGAAVALLSARLGRAKRETAELGRRWSHAPKDNADAQAPEV